MKVSLLCTLLLKALVGAGADLESSLWVQRSSEYCKRATTSLDKGPSPRFTRGYFFFPCRDSAGSKSAANRAF